MKYLSVLPYLKFVSLHWTPNPTLLTCGYNNNPIEVLQHFVQFVCASMKHA